MTETEVVAAVGTPHQGEANRLAGMLVCWAQDWRAKGGGTGTQTLKYRLRMPGWPAELVRQVAVDVRDRHREAPIGFVAIEVGFEHKGAFNPVPGAGGYGHDEGLLIVSGDDPQAITFIFQRDCHGD